MTTDGRDLYNVPMPTSTTRRPAPKLAASRSVAAAEAAVSACKDALEVAETFLAWVSTAEQVAADAERLAREGSAPVIVFAQADITKALGVARQTTQKQYSTGKYPPPNLKTPDDVDEEGRPVVGRPLWFPEVLHHAGIIPDHAVPAAPRPCRVGPLTTTDSEGYRDARRP